MSNLGFGVQGLEYRVEGVRESFSGAQVEGPLEDPPRGIMARDHAPPLLEAPPRASAQGYLAYKKPPPRRTLQ